MNPSFERLRSSFGGDATWPSGIPIAPSRRQVFKEMVLSEECEAVSASSESVIE